MHPDTLTSVNNLGSLLKAQGKLDEAEPLYRRALQAREETLGQMHPRTKKSALGLYNLLAKTGRHDEAAQPRARHGV